MTQVSLDQRWALASNVAVRPESFGAVAYHYGNRRLTLLKDQSLVHLLHCLTDADSVRQAMERAGVGDVSRQTYLAALQALADADMIRPTGEPTT